MEVWGFLAGLAAAVAGLWLVIVVFLFAARPQRAVVAESIRLLPDLLRLIRRLWCDERVSRSSKVWLAALVAYLAFPIDLIPDFIPVIGYADDVIAVLFVLRRVLVSTDSAVVEAHWTGSTDALAAIRRACGVSI